MSEASTAPRTVLLGPDEGPPLGPFARDLRVGHGVGTRFLPAMPQDEAAWTAALRGAVDATEPVPAALATALAARQHALGAGPAAVRNAESLAASESRTVAVVTGQQPGLLGGPLLTFHKAAGAIALARKLDGLGGVRVVPVFWLASEDHDLDEANRAGLLGRDGQLHTLRLDLAADGRSLVDVALPLDMRAALLAEAAALLPDTDRARAALALAEGGATENFSSWAAQALVRILGDSGLVVVEPEVLDRWVAPTYDWLLDHAPVMNAAIREVGTALAAADLPAPLAPSGDETPLFLRAQRGGPRLRVSVDANDAVALRGEDTGYDRAHLKSIWASDPGLAAGNVIGRVFVQNRHLPTLAYIAGPTEIAYQAQLRGAAAALGEPFPLALPRPEATWVNTRDSAAATDFGLPLGRVIAGDEPPPSALEATLAEQARTLRQHLDDLAASAEPVAKHGARTAEALGRLQARLESTFDKGWSSVLRSAAGDEGVGRARFERLRNAVRPHGRPQERRLSPLSLIARYGVEAVRSGLLALDPLAPAHQLVRLGQEPASP